MKKSLSKISGWFVFTLAIMFSSASAEQAALTITHEPASWAIKGQALTLRAKVTGGSGGIDNVTLYYALFKDAAPFRVDMTSSGMDMYVGTIESGVLSDLASISYYIEAQDAGGAIEETPWYDVSFKDPESKGSEADRSNVPAPVEPTSGRGKKTSGADDGGGSALTIGLIAGGAVALGAGAYLVSQSGGSDDDNGGGGVDTNTVPPNRTGTYSGTATIITSFGTNQTSDVNPSASVIVDSKGVVYSETLYDGADLETTLAGNSFRFSEPVNSSNRVGTIVFDGFFTGDSGINGSISGNFTEDGVAGGTFSGSFSLFKN